MLWFNFCQASCTIATWSRIHANTACLELLNLGFQHWAKLLRRERQIFIQRWPRWPACNFQRKWASFHVWEGRWWSRSDRWLHYNCACRNCGSARICQLHITLERPLCCRIVSKSYSSKSSKPRIRDNIESFGVPNPSFLRQTKLLRDRLQSLDSHRAEKGCYVRATFANNLCPLWLGSEPLRRGVHGHCLWPSRFSQRIVYL